ncbi:MAG: hypothetical protein ACP5I4_01960 [Oceanipulchritudo sp.]
MTLFTDLQLWDEYPAVPETIDPDFDGDGSTRLIQYSVPIPANGDPVFLRLQVELAP